MPRAAQGAPQGNLWIITPDARSVAEWCDKSLIDPRYIVHPNGGALAISFTSDDDEVLFRMMYPALVRNELPQALLDNANAFANLCGMVIRLGQATVSIVQDGERELVRARWEALRIERYLDVGRPHGVLIHGETIKTVH